MAAPKATIVVPCYNEAERLEVEAFRTFARARLGYRFLFVDDGSTDDTRAVLDALANQTSGSAFSVLSLRQNAGKAEAVRRGILAALGGTSPVVGFWDADLSTPLSAVPVFCDLLSERPGLEMVFGARVQLLGRTIERHLWRHYLGRLFATVVSNMLALEIYDTQCGAKLFRVTPHLGGLFREPFTSDWVFDVELLARRIALRRRQPTLAPLEDVVYEYPLHEWRDAPGSKISPASYAKAAGSLVRIWHRYGLWRRGASRPATPSHEKSEQQRH